MIKIKIQDRIWRRPKPRTKFYPPTFSGRHNKTKAMVLLTLHHLWLENPHRYITARRIVELTPVNYRSLLTLLKHWTDWSLISRIQRKRFLVYRIRIKARKYLKRYKDTVPLEQYVAEINAFRQKNHEKPLTIYFL